MKAQKIKAIKAKIKKKFIWKLIKVKNKRRDGEKKYLKLTRYFQLKLKDRMLN